MRLYPQKTFCASWAGIDVSHHLEDVIEDNEAGAIQRYVERGIAEIVEPVKKEKAIKNTDHRIFVR